MHSVKKLEWWGYRVGKKVWRYLQPSGYNPPTCRTDGWTDGPTVRHQATAKTALTHTSRGKKTIVNCEI